MYKWIKSHSSNQGAGKDQTIVVYPKIDRGKRPEHPRESFAKVHKKYKEEAKEHLLRVTEI